jgi:flagellar basal body-associated protein FliL
MTREKKKTTLILLLIHILQFVFVASMMFITFSKTDVQNEVSTAIEQAALTQQNDRSSVIVGLASAIPDFSGVVLLPSSNDEEGEKV